MPIRPHPSPRSAERGATLVEMMMAMVILALGILAIGQLFPAGTRTQLQDRMLTTASCYAQEKIEQCAPLTWSDPDLTLGRHPAGTATEDLGASGAWHRFYLVEQLPVPLDNLKKITVTVSWTFLRSRQVTAVTYLRR